MPMDFPDMNSLKRCAAISEFRQPHEGEDETTYRAALADHMETIDYIESIEIRNGIGWDKLLRRARAGYVASLLSEKPDRSGGRER